MCDWTFGKYSIQIINLAVFVTVLTSKRLKNNLIAQTTILNERKRDLVWQSARRVCFLWRVWWQVAAHFSAETASQRPTGHPPDRHDHHWRWSVQPICAAAVGLNTTWLPSTFSSFCSASRSLSSSSLPFFTAASSSSTSPSSSSSSSSSDLWPRGSV